MFLCVSLNFFLKFFNLPTSFMYEMISYLYYMLAFTNVLYLYYMFAFTEELSHFIIFIFLSLAAGSQSEALHPWQRS